MNIPILYRSVLLSLFIAVFFLSGCGKKKPTGFPGVFPCKITVTKGGEALPNITVMLVPEIPANNLSITGDTDQNGEATIRTMSSSYSAEGAPEGKFVVILLDNVSIDLPEVAEEEYESWLPQKRQDWDADIAKKIEASRIVPGSLRNPIQSQASITVTSSGGEAMIDIAEHR